MSVLYDEELKIFHLATNKTSYVIEVVKDGYLAHRYWGKKISRFRDSNTLVSIDHPLSPNPYPHRKESAFSLDTLTQEYPGYGTSDFRMPAYQIQQESGSTITDLRVYTHRISSCLIFPAVMSVMPLSECYRMYLEVPRLRM